MADVVMSKTEYDTMVEGLKAAALSVQRDSYPHGMGCECPTCMAIHKASLVMEEIEKRGY